MSVQQLSLYQWTFWDTNKPVSFSVIASTVDGAITKILNNLETQKNRKNKVSTRHFESTMITPTSIVWKSQHSNTADKLLDINFGKNNYNYYDTEEEEIDLTFEEKLRSTKPHHKIPIIENGILINQTIMITHSSTPGF